jgi:DNA-directed RNA polymerase subunit RPC12/RpoP
MVFKRISLELGWGSFMESKETRDCQWFNPDECEDCKGTVNDFKYKCKRDEMFVEMAYQCPKCKTGIINPTYYGTLVCDKCSFDEPIREVIKIYKDLEKYI